MPIHLRIPKNLTFRFFSPMILTVSVAGGCLFWFLFASLSEFIESHIQGDLESQSRAIYNIGDQSLNELLYKGHSANKIAIRIAKAKAQGIIDDYMREKQLLGIIIDDGGEIHRSADLPEEIIGNEFIVTPENQLIEWIKGDGRYYLYHFQFDPWQWHIILVKDAVLYTFLINKVKKLYFIITILFALGTFLLLFYLRQNINHPVKLIIDSLKKGIQPKYRGIYEFEFLSEHIADMMGKLQQSHSLLEKRVGERTIELEMSRREAEKASRYKSEFLANMSHEIRTPMNSILNMTRLALDMEPTPELGEYLSIIDLSTHSLLRIIDDILDFSKIEAGKLEMEITPFQLRFVLEEALALFSERVREKKVELLYDIADDVPDKLIGDPLRLNQVFSNLVGNSMKFTDHGQIIIRVKCINKRNKRVRLAFSIEDSGVGIDQERMEQMFSPFEQADGSVTRKFGGTGLGLPICRRLVTMMGGKIWAESKAGEGSVFHFTAEFELQRDISKPDTVIPADLHGLKILLIDANPISKGIMASKLAAFTFQVEPIATGREALEKIKGAISAGAPFQLMIMDWKPEEEDSVEIWEEINKSLQLGCQVPSIIVTSFFRRKTDIERAEAAGVDAILQKPIKDSALFNVIMKVCCKSDSCMLANAEKISRTPMEKLNGSKILLVEDNELNQRVAIELLQVAGIKDIRIAFNGIQAVQVISEAPDFDAVLMDVQMPEMDGFEATRKIRRNKRFKKLPIIAMTAHVMQGDREKCLAAGMDDYVGKPIEPAMLYSTLTKWITPKAEGKESIGEQVKSRSTRSDDELPDSLPGIDLEVVARRYGHNKPFYLDLLKAFAFYYANMAHEIRQKVENGEVEAAQHLAHLLKGLAGNICANELHTAVMELDTVLKKEDLTHIEPLLQLVANRLEEVTASAGLITDSAKRDEVPEEEPGDIVLSQEQIVFLSDFTALLKRNDLKAEEYLQLLKQLPGFRTGPGICGLEERMRRFQYKEALTILTDIMTTKGITLNGSDV